MHLDTKPLIDTWVIKHPKISQYWIAGKDKWCRNMSRAKFFHSITAIGDTINKSDYLRNMGAYAMPVLVVPYEQARRNMKARSIRLTQRRSHGRPREWDPKQIKAVSFISERNLYTMFKAYCAKRDISTNKAFRKFMRLCVRYDGREIPVEKVVLI
jgi:hypothetical protein